MSASPLRRRLVALVAALAAGLGLSTVAATPAFAGSDGYVRLAHLSPDTGAVDVYLSSVSGAVEQKFFPAVSYGTVSSYIALPPGTYAVSMRNKGAAPTSAPVLTTQATVEAGKAYTVAGVGRYADLGLRVISDDLALPPKGQAKVRVVQASVRAPLLDVAAVGGSVIADNARFATTTPYADVRPGSWTLRVTADGNPISSTVTAKLDAGSVYSLIILDNASGGLKAELRVDASGSSNVPLGGVPTGAGGTATRHSGLVGLVAGGAGLLVVVVGLFMRRRLWAFGSRKLW